MERGMDGLQSLTKREIPKISGSSAAFIAVIVILVTVIIVSCTAVVYILREDFRQGEHAHRQSRDRYRDSRRIPIFGPLARLLGGSGSRQQSNNERADKPRSTWTHAENDSNWDLEHSLAGEELTQYTQNATASTPMRMARHESTGTSRSSNMASLPPSSRLYLPGPDSEPHNGRGISYAEQSSVPRHSLIPSIHSQIYSPTPSISSPLSRHPTASTSNESLERLSNHASIENLSAPNPFVEVSSQSIKTFNSGSKFIEGL